MPLTCSQNVTRQIQYKIYNIQHLWWGNLKKERQWQKHTVANWVFAKITQMVRSKSDDFVTHMSAHSWNFYWSLRVPDRSNVLTDGLFARLIVTLMAKLMESNDPQRLRNRLTDCHETIRLESLKTFSTVSWQSVKQSRRRCCFPLVWPLVYSLRQLELPYKP